MPQSPKNVSHHPCYRLTHTEAACSFSVLVEEFICYVLMVVTMNVYLCIKLCGITSCKRELIIYILYTHIPINPSRLSSDKLQTVRILFLWHEAAPSRMRVRQSNKTEFLTAIQD